MNLPVLSNIELFHQARWLNDSLKDYYINNIYWVVKGTLLIRLHHTSYPEKRLVIDCGKAIWVTDTKLEGEISDNLLNLFRKKLNRGKIYSISQLGTERIVSLNLIGSEARKLVAEFFSNGNIILLDEDDIISAALEYYETRHRTIAMGSKYTPPPARGIDPLKIDERFLRSLLAYEEDFRKWIGKNISLSKKYVDTLPSLLDVPYGTTGRQLDEQKLKTLILIILGFFKENCKNIKPTIYLKGEDVVDYSIFPISSTQYTTREVENLNLTIDTIHTKSNLEKKEQTLLHPVYKEREGLRNTIDNLSKKKEKLTGDQKALSDIAKRIKENIGLYYQDTNQFETILYPAKMVIDNDSAEILYESFKFGFDKANPLKTCSEIFNTTKTLLQEISKIEYSIGNLKKDLEKIEKKIESKEEFVIQKSGKVFEKEWFERYRWFYTSEGLLAIGGRDASSNEAIIKKHLDDEDIIFHAEFTGAPFFIIKKGRKATEPSIREVASAAIAFSNLWKFGTSTGEAYWVFKEQISKGAPSGQYIGKGAFMITGKRNYVKNIKLELTIGITKVKDHYSVIGGPKDALKNYIEAEVPIIPGKEEKGYIAKKIKAIIVQKMNLSDEIKMMPLEDFVRVLPPGGCKVKI